MNLCELAGEVLAHIDIDPERDEILLTTASGRRVLIYHEQECCESVRIEDTEGNWYDLVGKPLLLVEHEENVTPVDPEDADTRTLTTFTFKVDGATVINRWIGESTGYYSESVDIEELDTTAV